VSTGSKISIAMAVYNGDRFIGEQLESFVRQTRLPDELVVSDNASTDRTVEIVRDFARRAPFKVRLVINDRNLGAAKNFERAITECTGDVIFLSDCDDVWYLNKVSVMGQASPNHRERASHSPTLTWSMRIWNLSVAAYGQRSVSDTGAATTKN